MSSLYGNPPYDDLSTSSDMSDTPDTYNSMSFPLPDFGGAGETKKDIDSPMDSIPSQGAEEKQTNALPYENSDLLTLSEDLTADKLISLTYV